MSQYNEGSKTFSAGGSVTLYARVKLSGATVVVAGANESAIGFAQGAGSSGDQIVVALESRGRTYKAVAGEAFSAGATLYAGANGKVVDTDGGSYTARYSALESASGDGSIVEVLPLV